MKRIETNTDLNAMNLNEASQLTEPDMTELFAEDLDGVSGGCLGYSPNAYASFLSQVAASNLVFSAQNTRFVQQSAQGVFPMQGFYGGYYYY